MMKSHRSSKCLRFVLHTRSRQPSSSGVCRTVGRGKIADQHGCRAFTFRACLFNTQTDQPLTSVYSGTIEYWATVGPARRIDYPISLGDRLAGPRPFRLRNPEQLRRSNRGRPATGEKEWQLENSPQLKGRLTSIDLFNL